MQMYLLVMLDSFKQFLNGMIFVAAVATPLSLIVIIAVKNEGSFLVSKKWFFVPVFSAVVWFGIGLASAILPTTKQAAAIIVLPKIINNAKVQELPDKLLGLAEAWMEELKPKAKENHGD